MKIIISLLAFTLFSFALTAQQDWSLPRENKAIVIRDTSKIFSSKKDIATYFLGGGNIQELSLAMRSELDGNKGNVYFSKHYNTMGPSFTSQNMDNPFFKSNPKTNDTLYGSIVYTVNRNSMNLIGSFSMITIKFRIVFYTDNHYEIIYKGITLNASSGTSEVKALEEIYNDVNPSNKDKQLYKDILFMCQFTTDAISKYIDRKILAEF